MARGGGGREDGAGVGPGARGSGAGGVRRGGRAGEGGLRGGYPVFQRQVGHVGEVPSVARDEREAVRQRCAADENVKIIYRPTTSP